MPQKRIYTVYQDLSQATEWSRDFKDLGFEPTELRVIQYAMSNTDVAVLGGAIICPQIRDFNLLAVCPPNWSIVHSSHLICPTAGPISTLTFRLTTNGSGAAEAVQNAKVYFVLEFYRP